MLSSVTTAGTAFAGAAVQNRTAGAASSAPNSPAGAAGSATASVKATSVSVVVSLSTAAASAVSSPAASVKPGGSGSAASSYFGQFYPTHEGFSADALSAAVTDPGLESISAGKSLSQVGKDARASLDERYKRLEAAGKPFDYIHARSEDVNSLYGELDRRALYAVVSNEGGQFSKEEQDLAQMLMGQQQGLATGLYSGPTSQIGKFVDPYGNDNAARTKAAVKWLDRVGADEKAGSVAWAVQRAANQSNYELLMEDRGQVPEDLGTEHPLVNLIRAALATGRNDPTRGLTFGPVDTADRLKAQPWFKGFEHRLDTAVAQTKAMYAPAG